MTFCFQRYRYILHVIDLWSMDKVYQNWIIILVNSMRFGLLLHGLIMGRIRVLNQSDSYPRTGTHDHW